MADEKNFDELTKDLTSDQRAGLLNAMADAKIKKSDTELVSILMFLKLTREDFGTIRTDIKKSVHEAKKLAEFIELHSNTMKTAFTQFDELYAKKMENMSKTLDATSERVIKKLNTAYTEHQNIIHHLKHNTEKIKWIRWRNILMFNIIICIIVGLSVWFYKDYADKTKYIYIKDAEIMNRKDNDTLIKFR